MIPFLTVFLAWAFQAFTGFGAGIFIVGVLSLWYDPKEVVVSSALVNVVGTALLLFQNRRGKVDFKVLFYLIIPSIPAIYAGAHLLKSIDRDILRLMIGAFVVLLGVYDMLVQRGLLRIKLNKKSGPLAGFLGGLFAGLVGLGGPPPAVYLNQNTQDKDSFKLMLNLYFTSNILFRLAFYYLEGVLFINREIVLNSLLAVPLGVFVGGFLVKSFSGREFRYVVSFSVIFLGFALMVL